MESVRPKLSLIAPLTAAICWGYAFVNMGLGLGMFFIYQGTIAPISVASILSYRAWGSLFFLIGAATAYGLLSNKWDLTRKLQLGGLSLKALWAVALILRCLDNPQTILITLVWIFFAYIQAVTYIHFIPRSADEPL